LFSLFNGTLLDLFGVFLLLSFPFSVLLHLLKHLHLFFCHGDVIFNDTHLLTLVLPLVSSLNELRFATIISFVLFGRLLLVFAFKVFLGLIRFLEIDIEVDNISDISDGAIIQV